MKRNESDKGTKLSHSAFGIGTRNLHPGILGGLGDSENLFRLFKVKSPSDGFKNKKTHKHAYVVFSSSSSKMTVTWSVIISGLEIPVGNVNWVSLEVTFR